MKKLFIAASLAVFLVIGLSADAQSVTVNSVPPSGLMVPIARFNGVFTIIRWVNVFPSLVDGTPATVAWSSPTATPDMTTEVTMIGIIGGQESWSYNIAVGQSNPASAKLSMIPRVLRQSGESYKVRVIWRNVFGDIVSTADSYIFKMYLQTPRSITMTEPLNLPTPWVVSRGTSTWIRWNSCNIPPSAKLECWLQPYGNSEVGGIKISDTSDTGGFKWNVPGDLAVGKYVLTIFYVTEYGFFGAESNVAVVDVQ